MSMSMSMSRLSVLAISSRNLVWVRNHSRPALLPMVRLWSAASRRRWKADSGGCRGVCAGPVDPQQDYALLWSSLDHPQSSVKEYLPGNVLKDSEHWPITFEVAVMAYTFLWLYLWSPRTIGPAGPPSKLKV
jgi:hypothetical protein